jgi:hypothetical protein
MIRHRNRKKRRKRRQAEEQLDQQRLRQQRMLGVGTGAAAGGIVLGKHVQNNYHRSDSMSNEEYEEATNSFSQPNIPESEFQPPTNAVAPQPLNFKNVAHEFQLDASVNALFLRDLSRFDSQIVDGINSNQLGWAGATGIEGTFSILPVLDADAGMNVGFMLAQGDDESRSASAQLLYTTPNLGFAPNPFRSYRDTELATVQANLLLPKESVGNGAVGIRWFHMGDTLTNQVLPNGLHHRVHTTSDSFVLQCSLAPTLEFKRVRVESLFQIGVGPMFGKSRTQLRNFVGGPPGLANEIVVDRVSGTAFFHGKLGLAIPIRKWLTTSLGVQLVAQTDMAEAAAQMSHTDFANQRYHLRTESMVLGGLFAGLEVRR